MIPFQLNPALKMPNFPKEKKYFFYHPFTTPLSVFLSSFVIFSILFQFQLFSFLQIFLNVCRPLVPKYGLGCPGGTAVCMGKIDSNTGKPEEEQVRICKYDYVKGILFISPFC